MGFKVDSRRSILIVVTSLFGSLISSVAITFVKYSLNDYIDDSEVILNNLFAYDDDSSSTASDLD